MPKFSANLGFLWTDRPLPDAICAAHDAGFDAVECHWPYDTDTKDINAALAHTGIPMLGLNTSRGNPEQGDNGLSALPDRMPEAKDAIDQALSYAMATQTRNIHVMAGNAAGTAAHDVFLENLHYATRSAAPHDITILIEPLNAYDAPEYFLRTTDQAAAIITNIDAPNLKLMFDCYHVGRTEGDILARFHKLRPLIGHIQFASVPDRLSPDQGTIDFDHVFKELDAAGYSAPLGAEYKPMGPTENSLTWMTND